MTMINREKLTDLVKKWSTNPNIRTFERETTWQLTPEAFAVLYPRVKSWPVSVDISVSGGRHLSIAFKAWLNRWHIPWFWEVNNLVLYCWDQTQTDWLTFYINVSSMTFNEIANFPVTTP